MGDNGGIYSLAGFAYQIKVFVLHVLELKNGYTLEYETIDDVRQHITVIKKYLIQELDIEKQSNPNTNKDTR